MSSTPTKAEKENGRSINDDPILLSLLYDLNLLPECVNNNREEEYKMLLILEHWRLKKVEHKKSIDALSERLRLAEEFIRSNQYRDKDELGEMYCLGCCSAIGLPCDSNCELQKILEKGEG